MGALATALIAVALASVWGIALVVGGPGAVACAVIVTPLVIAAAWVHRRERAVLAESGESARRALHSAAEAAGVPAPDETPERAAIEVRRWAEGLRAQVGSLAAVLDALDEPVLAVNTDGVVVTANREAERLVPRGAGGAVGVPFEHLVPDEQAATAVRRAIGGEASRTQTRLLMPEGPRILEISAEPLPGAPGGPGAPVAVAVLRDVTEQATALQLKTDFVANASHELRTPLASIKTAAETLADLGGESPELRARLVSMISSNAERLEELTRDLLDLSSLESAEQPCTPERIDVSRVARELHDLFETACAQRRLALQFEIDPRLSSVWADGRLLRLVLRNLIDNAVKFAYEGTTIRVCGTVFGTGEGGRAGARFEVIDRGIGIPLAQQQRIFERFYQVDSARTGLPRRRGTGLGLAIVKHGLRALGGTIQVRSVWQQGTTMTVELPGCVDFDDRVSA